MKEKIGIYYNISEPFNYSNEIFTIHFFNSIYDVVFTTAYKLDPIMRISEKQHEST
jgi:hypothetical protein